MIEEDIRQALQGIAQGHVHPLRRPQNEGFPAVVYTLIATDYGETNTLCGPSEQARHRVQLDCYDTEYRKCRALARDVRERLDAIGTRISFQLFPDDDEKAYRWLVEFDVWAEA
jgi:hypothetical protein